MARSDEVSLLRLEMYGFFTCFFFLVDFSVLIESAVKY